MHQLQPVLLLPEEQRGAREESPCTILRFQSQVWGITSSPWRTERCTWRERMHRLLQIPVTGMRYHRFPWNNKIRKEDHGFLKDRMTLFFFGYQKSKPWIPNLHCPKLLDPNLHWWSTTLCARNCLQCANNMVQMREVCGHLQVSEGAVQTQKGGAPGGSHQTCQVDNHKNFTQRRQSIDELTIDNKTKCCHLTKLTCKGTKSARTTFCIAFHQSNLSTRQSKHFCVFKKWSL